MERQTSREESREVMSLENIVCSCLSVSCSLSRRKPGVSEKVLLASAEDLGIMLCLYEEILNTSSIPRANL